MKKQIADKLVNLPPNSGVYLMKDIEGVVLYVGKAASLRQRVRSYFHASVQWNALTQPMLRYVDDIDFVVTPNNVEALVLENNLIKKHQPRYNVKLKDDKRYPYLKVSVGETFPGLFVTRQADTTGGRFFGPFVHVRAIRQTIKQLTKVFPIRTCTLDLKASENSHRVCLDYHIKRCPGPCANLISTAEYEKIVQNVCRFLGGNTREVIRELKERMELAAAELDFEGAAKYRDQIETITQATDTQHLDTVSAADEDVIGVAYKGTGACAQVLMVRNGKLIDREHYFLNDVDSEFPMQSLTAFVQQYYQNASFIPKKIVLPNPVDMPEVIQNWLSEKRGSATTLHVPQKGRMCRLVEMASKNADLILSQKELKVIHMAGENPALIELQELLKLARPPQRIEGFDISNLGNRFAVGSMVVMEDGEPTKSEYRRFKIRTVDRQNDFAMMKEVLNRRLCRAIEENSFPDLMLIDGGKGQLGAACEVLNRLDLSHLPVIGIAKRCEFLFLPQRADPIVLRHDNSTLHLFQRLRDEAHRFAVTYHRKLRDREISHSVLDEIRNIGPRRKKSLLQYFGSIENIRCASLDQLLSVKGITHVIAADTQKHLSLRGADAPVVTKKTIVD